MKKKSKTTQNKWRDLPCSLRRKSQYCENNYTTQSNLQIKCNFYPNTNGIFHRNRTKNFTLCMETQKTLDRKSNLEKRKTELASDLYWEMLQSLSFMVLAPKQKCINGTDESPDSKPTLTNTLSSTKEAKNTQCRKDNSFNEWCSRNWRILTFKAWLQSYSNYI